MAAAAVLVSQLAGVAPAINIAPLAQIWTSWTTSIPGISGSAVAASTPVIVREPQIDIFDMKLHRTAGVSTPFRLRVVGAAEAATGVLLQGLPAGAQLSRGERRDESTWAVKAAELADLHLTFAGPAPEAFDIRIEVLTAPGVDAASSIARVRVVDVPPVAPQVMATPSAPVAAPAVTAAVAVTPVAVRTTTVARAGTRVERPTRPAPAPTPAPVAQVAPEPEPQVAQAEERHFPEGASALGAIPRGDERQVWWKLPAPTWSPFLDSASR